jgi:hypothetical protein
LAISARGLPFYPACVRDIEIINTADDVASLARKHRLLDYLRVKRGEEAFSIKESSAPPVFMLVQLPGAEVTVYGFYAWPGDYPERVLSVSSVGSGSKSDFSAGPATPLCACGALGTIGVGWFVRSPERARWFCGECYRADQGGRS